MVQNESLLAFGFGRILSVPYSVWILIAVFAAAHFIAERTAIGRSIFAIGASPRAALLSGLNVNRMRFWTFVASGISAAVAGVLLIGQSGAAGRAARLAGASGDHCGAPAEPALRAGKARCSALHSVCW
jgi:ribose/xylose/arabinose/galactoside ABC-type transport system permease subunit